VSRRAAFLDRDGVLNEPVPDPVDGRPESPLRPEDVRLVDGAADGARALRDAGFALVVVTNQPAAAKGKATVADIEAVNERVRELLRQAGVELDGWRTCLHHPDAAVPELGGACDCRKPAPGMLIDMARELELDLSGSWMLGDSDVDVVAGRAAGCRTVLIEHPLTAHRRSDESPADARHRNLRDAAAFVTGRASP
jgi:D-glycero-D-manno-heptose 1,7-bisphosphate phosphatase